MVFQVQVVLDNAVVDHGEFPPVADLGWELMSEGAPWVPTGCGDAHGAGEGDTPLQNALQHA